jgi:uncharacterized membrane protein
MLKSTYVRWAIVLGFALGGFFDGILLHQILQWHHLLSLVPAVDSLRLQVLWDGYFHALMYLVAAIGLWGLWRSRTGLAEGDGRPLLGGILIGFGLWHMVDSVLSHWILGIHRIKLDSPNPLMWDLIWFAAFGAIPMLAGWIMLQRRSTIERLSRPTMSIIVVGLLTAGAGIWAARPPKNQPYTTVVFSPAVTPQAVMAALVSEEAGIVWSDPAMGVLVVAVDKRRRFNFFKHGALFVSGAGTAAGCFNWNNA